MAPYKLHYDPSSRPEYAPAQRKTSSRLPTKSGAHPSTQTGIPTASSSAAATGTFTKQRPSTAAGRAPSKMVNIEGTESGRADRAVPAAHAASSYGLNGSLRAPSQGRSRQLSSSRPATAPTVYSQTPSLVSGSSASTEGSPNPGLEHSFAPRPTFRGLHYSTSQDNGQHIMHTAASGKEALLEPGVGYAISTPPLGDTSASENAPLPQYHHNDSRLATFTPTLGSEDLLPPASLYAFSASPSTRYSGSPGPFSHSSTPTSMSSYSPAFSMSARTAQKMRQPSPTMSRPPVTRRHTDETTSRVEPHGLPSLRESTTSSSSASTIKVAEIENQKVKGKQRTKKTRLQPSPPSPPPRKSSAPSQRTQQRPNKDTKPIAPSNVAQPLSQRPPELAHLTTASPPEPLVKIPSRPSRDGAPHLVDPRGPSPIIQSNMASLPLHIHKRTGSTESKMSGIHPPPSPGAWLGTQRRMASPSPSNPKSSLEAPSQTRSPAKSATPERTPEREGRKLRKVSTQASLAPTKSTSKFGFFTRRAKTEPLPASVGEKPARKGPMAGTGHEGYGKYATRGRSGSKSSRSGSMGRSDSADSQNGSLAHSVSSRKSSITSSEGAEMDGFLLDRLAPVIIRGEGSAASSVTSADDERNHVQPQLGKSWAGMGSSVSSVGTVDSKGAGSDSGKPTLLPSAMSYPVRGLSPSKRDYGSHPRPSESGDDEESFYVPSRIGCSPARGLADEEDDLHAMSALEQTTSALSNQSARKDSRDQGRRGGVAATEASENAEAKGAGWLKSRGNEIRSKLPMKWNFFQRAQASPKIDASVAEVPVTVARLPASRTVAHYAMLDSTQNVDLEDLERLMEEADRSQEELSGLKPFAPTQKVIRYENAHSMLLPSPPSFAKSFPAMPQTTSPEQVSPTAMEPATQAFAPLDKVTSHVSDASPTIPDAARFDVGPKPKPKPKPASRLAHVGRIPQVVPTGDRDRRLPVQSFSRPFVSTQPLSSVQSPQSAYTSASDPPASAAESNQMSPQYEFGPASVSPNERLQNGYFLAFPPRRGSDMSCSTSSGGVSFRNLTAIVPPANAPLEEDEVWDEYDDLLDVVLTGKDTRTKTTKAHTTTTESNDIHNDEQAMTADVSPKQTQQSPPQSILRTSSGSRSNMQRKSRLLSSLHSAVIPNSPYSITDFVTGYGERNLAGSDHVNSKLGTPSKLRHSGSSHRSSLPPSSVRGSTTSSKSSRSQDDAKVKPNYRDTRLMEMAETQNDGLLSMANLRFGALMTSKWLSFGRVLFSPAHSELKDASEDRVLILDGLGKGELSTRYRVCDIADSI